MEELKRREPESIPSLKEIQKSGAPISKDGKVWMAVYLTK